MFGRLTLRTVALGYLTLLLALPVGIVFYNTFSSGVGAVWNAVTQPDALHALWMTLLVTGIAVPANTAFGIVCALALVRSDFRFKRLLDAVIDLPFAVSPVVVGLSLFIVYGRESPFGTWLMAHGVHVIFAWPGMVLATIFVSLPFVVREVAPTLAEVGIDQEQAAAVLGASAWQTFWRVTLPAVRWGVIYGVVLSTARSLGEFGAVSVVSGHLAGRTETLTLYVEDRYQAFDPVGAYTAAVILAILAFITLAVMNWLATQEKRKWQSLPAASASPSATTSR